MIIKFLWILFKHPEASPQIFKNLQVNLILYYYITISNKVILTQESQHNGRRKVLTFSNDAITVGWQLETLVMFGTGIEDHQRVRNIRFGQIKAGWPVGQQRDVVSYRPRRAALIVRRRTRWRLCRLAYRGEEGAWSQHLFKHNCKLMISIEPERNSINVEWRKRNRASKRFRNVQESPSTPVHLKEFWKTWKSRNILENKRNRSFPTKISADIQCSQKSIILFQVPKS